jgi:DNA repair protein RecO (recombination protein O)
LRRQDLGEADRLLTIFTPERGKLRVVAKGVRKPRSRKAGHLEPLTRTRLMFARGRELDIITQAEAIELYPTLREDLIKLGQASYVVELLDRFTVEEGASERLYELLVDSLDRLEAGQEAYVALRFFELRMLDLVGYRPELFHCLGCKSEIRPQDQFFSLALGGVLCPACGRNQRDAFTISLAALKVLRYYQRNAYSVVAAAKVRATVHSELNTIMESYLTYLLERRLNSPTFLRRVRELGQKAYESENAS